MNSGEHEMWEFVEAARKEWKTLPAEEVAFPRGVSQLRKFIDSSSLYTSGTPIHARGSILYNHFLKEKNLDRKYELINDGDKIKFVYLKLPNPIKENVIAFPMILPKEFDIEAFINYDLQFDKAFIEPLKAVINTIGWNVEPVASLESFFG